MSKTFVYLHHQTHTMKLTTEFANKVYDILVEIGAHEDDRNSFVYHHTNDDECREWRFCGNLGFGGKYYANENIVSCYSEDETKSRLKLIESTNQKLIELVTAKNSKAFMVLRGKQYGNVCWTNGGNYRSDWYELVFETDIQEEAQAKFDQLFFNKKY